MAMVQSWISDFYADLHEQCVECKVSCVVCGCGNPVSFVYLLGSIHRVESAYCFLEIGFSEVFVWLYDSYSSFLFEAPD
jgi:hypothetical protein